MDETCEIGFYVSYQSAYGRAEMRFRAEADRPEERVTVAESPIFKGEAAAGPRQADAEHRDALATLVARLAADGWIPAGQGATWYANRFVRKR